VKNPEWPITHILLSPQCIYQNSTELTIWFANWEMCNTRSVNCAVTNNCWLADRAVYRAHLQPALKETYGDWYREIITCRLSFLTVNNETLKVQYNTDGFSILVQCHVCVLQQWQWRCNNMSDPLPGWTSYKAIKPGFSLLHVSFCCVRFSFFSNKVSDWLGNTSEMTYFCFV